MTEFAHKPRGSACYTSPQADQFYKIQVRNAPSGAGASNPHRYRELLIEPTGFACLSGFCQ